MEQKTPRKAAMEMMLGLYDAHTRSFYNVLDGISDADAQQRLNSKANHMSWIAGSLVQERYELARLAGNSGLRQTSNELFKDHQGIKEGVTYPSLAEYKKDWEEIAPVLRTIFATLSEEQLGGPDPFDMPGGDFTLSDTSSFCIDRESYCLGQLGLWRRLLGYAPMKYA